MKILASFKLGSDNRNKDLFESKVKRYHNHRYLVKIYDNNDEGNDQTISSDFDVIEMPKEGDDDNLWAEKLSGNEYANNQIREVIDELYTCYEEEN